MAVAMALVGVRGHVANFDIALALVVCVVAGAVVGGRVAGAWSALVAALCFDFFHTQPFNSLKIANLDDALMTFLLLVVGLMVGDVAGRWRRARAVASDDRRQVRRLHRVAGLAARGETAADLLLAVTAELLDTLRLVDCRFELAPFDLAMPVLARDGTFTRTGGGRVRVADFPAGPVELPVVGAGQTVGRFVLVGEPAASISAERRLVAVALADQVGVALAASAAP